MRRQSTINTLLADYSADDRIAVVVSTFVEQSDDATTLATKMLGATCYAASHMSSHSRHLLASRLRDIADLCERDLVMG
jgi:hypothetical protein